MNTSPLVLVVDDEPDLVASLIYSFERDAFRTRSAANGGQALVEAARSPRPDLILLDLMLPDMPGNEVFRRLRADPATSDIPVVIVTAKNEEIDRIVGLELGADDYVTKPFSTRELLLRARAVLRRSRPTPQPLTQPHAAAQRVIFGCLRLDAAAHRVWVNDKETWLTPTEYLLLSFLFEQRGQVVSRQALLSEAWKDAGSVTVRTVDTHVKRLRQKLGPAADYIHTSRGFGYRFGGTVARESAS